MANLAAVPREADAADGAAAAEPQVLVRTFATPAGLPWDQARAARLEARHAAPLPISELHYRLKRLGGWAAGRPGEFAVFYLRRSDLTGAFATTVDVGGEAIRVSFGAKSTPSVHLGELGMLMLSLILSFLILGAVLVSGWSIRQDTTQQLEALEQQTASKLNLGRKLQHDQAQDRALAVSQGTSGQVADVLDDLAWIAHARTPGARILSVHWDHGLMAIETRGSAAPVASTQRQLIRAAKPGLAGTWLWGVTRTAAAPSAGSSPAATAELRP